MVETQARLRRVEIRAVLRRHRGAQADVALKAEVSPVSVSKWLKGLSTSAKIATVAERKALELLEQEKSLAA